MTDNLETRDDMSFFVFLQNDFSDDKTLIWIKQITASLIQSANYAVALYPVRVYCRIACTQ